MLTKDAEIQAWDVLTEAAPRDSYVRDALTDLRDDFIRAMLDDVPMLGTIKHRVAALQAIEAHIAKLRTVHAALTESVGALERRAAYASSAIERLRTEARTVLGVVGGA